jgi:exodeoxyribonuclease V beta subunit
MGQYYGKKTRFFSAMGKIWGDFMKQFNCLSEDQSIDGHFFLEASAGTGKTFAIEHIVSRLLSDKASPKKVDEILLVTFTRAATRDMRARILCNMENHEPPLLEAIAHFDESQIYTIHGFCHAMLQEYALEAGVAVSVDDPDDRAYLAIADEAIVDFFRTGVELPQYHPMQLGHLLRSSKGSFSALVKKVRNTALSQQKVTTVRSWGELSSQFPVEISEAIADEFAMIAPLFKGLCNVQKSPHEKYLRQIDMLLAGDSTLLLEDDLFFAYLAEENLKKNATLPSGELISLREEIIPLWEEASGVASIFARIVEDCRPLITKKLEEYELTPPDLLLEKMAFSLKKEQFYKLVRDRFSVAIIDEFQDTDPQQWEIFRTLFLADDKSLFLVGDPKQSIYGFRGADVGTYLQAKEDVGVENCYSLGTNYRSEPQLVRGLNSLFLQAQEWLGEIDYRAVEVNPEAVDSTFSDLKHNIHFVLRESRGGRSVPSSQEESQILFPYIASEIRSLGSPLSQVAILIKDRYQAIRMQTYLQELGIPAQAKGAVHIGTTKMFWVMEKVLMSLFDPSDTSVIKQLLGSPLARYSHWDLREPLEEEMHHFKELSLLMEKHGFAATFSRLLETSFRGKKVLHHLTSGSELTDYVDFNQIGELLIERSIAKLDRVEDLLDYMQEITKGEIEEHSEFKRRLVLQGEAVQIMTTHMSKGLEFSVVFALGMACRSPHDDNPLEKMRQFYVALTRAKKRVYLPLIHCEKKGNSPVELFMAHLMKGDGYSLEEVEDKIAALQLTCERVEATRVMPMENRACTRVQQPKELPHFPVKTVHSFTSLATHSEIRQREAPAEIELPLGAKTGTFLHNLLEKVIDRGLYSRVEGMHQFIQSEVRGTAFEQFKEVIFTMIERVFSVDLGGFSLQDVPPQHMVTESEFRFFLKTGVTIKGFADLLIYYEGKYYLVDWKSNFLGNEQNDYEADALHVEMQAREYYLQGAIYASALKKHLKIIESKPYEEVFGGAKYIFLRGIRWDGFGLCSFVPRCDSLLIQEGV